MRRFHLTRTKWRSQKQLTYTISIFHAGRYSSVLHVRYDSGSKKYDPITPTLKDLHCLPIRERIEFKILLLTFKCMQGCAPLYLRELLIKQANTRPLRSNTKNLLQIPHNNLKCFGDRAFCAYAPRLCSELPDNIKTADSVQNS